MEKKIFVCSCSKGKFSTILVTEVTSEIKGKFDRIVPVMVTKDMNIDQIKKLAKAN